MEDPLIDKNVITRCNCNNIHGGRAAPVYYHPFAIFHYLHLLRGNPSQSPLLLTKIIVLGAVTMISMERELLQAIITPPFAWKWNFLLFLAIFHHLCLLMGDPMTSSPHQLTKTLSLGTLAMISNKRKPVKAITDSSPPYLMPLTGLKWKNGFSHVCALPWASPGHFYIFFRHNLVVEV